MRERGRRRASDPAEWPWPPERRAWRIWRGGRRGARTPRAMAVRVPVVRHATTGTRRATRSRRYWDPTFSPSSSALGCATGCAESSTAAGRLLIATDASAPIPVVSQRPAPSSSCAGPSHDRARTPNATQTKNRLMSTTGPTARTTSRHCNRPRATSIAVRTSPTARTGIAGLRSAIVRTAAASAPGSPRPSASQLARCGCRLAAARSRRRKSTNSPSAVASVAASAITRHACGKRGAGDRVDGPRTSRFVRLDPRR